ncbi:flagellar hook-basal body protein [Viridibacillus arvi]|uniref:Uncharacterized protein n=1 Tax=Viridibacillus arvi TaxID=263475 RepID=A0A0M0LF19_9BACL|nr:flagellar hook-basal body protein [Viridibacillus arvi]KOO49700.1 hypothetical protein AMD00_15345 [Viridibacillus arvi]
MFRGFYTVATGMIAQQRRTELLSNNITNANTPGYKADQSTIRSFPDMLMSRMTKSGTNLESGLNTTANNQIGALNAGVYMQETLPDYSQGQITATDLTTDVALVDNQLPTDAETGAKGAIFFRLEHPTEGETYTRNGNFTLDPQGYLTNAQGLYVLSDRGQRIQLQNDDYQIMDDGRIIGAGEQEVARIGVSYAAQPDTLQKQDNGLYRTYNGEDLPSAYTVNGVSFNLKQGYIERSNVDASKTMTEMLTAYRAFEANQKVLQAYDRSMDKAVNEIGKV